MSAAATAESVFGDVRKNWGWLLALGIASIVLGTLGLSFCLFLTLAGVLFFGWLILIEGVIELVQVVKARGWKSVVWQILIAALHIAAGVIIVSDPVMASGILTLFLAAAILVSGVTRIAVAFQHRDQKGWGWLLFGGVVAVLLGLMIATRWPASSFFVIGLFIAIELIMNGWALVTLALAARATGELPPPAEEPA